MMIPTLNEISRYVTCRLAVHTHVHVMPGHAWQSFPIDQVLKWNIYILILLVSWIHVVLTGPQLIHICVQ